MLEENFPVTIPDCIHPIPFRTRWLRFSGPMIVPQGVKVGSCRNQSSGHPQVSLEDVLFLCEHGEVLELLCVLSVSEELLSIVGFESWLVQAAVSLDGLFSEERCSFVSSYCQLLGLRVGWFRRRFLWMDCFLRNVAASFL